MSELSTPYVLGARKTFHPIEDDLIVSPLCGFGAGRRVQAGPAFLGNDMKERIDFSSNTKPVPAPYRSTTKDQGRRGVTWPAHVKVQVIPGIERSEGQRADLYVAPSDKPGPFMAEWMAKRGEK